MLTPSLLSHSFSPLSFSLSSFTPQDKKKIKIVSELTSWVEIGRGYIHTISRYILINSYISESIFLQRISCCCYYNVWVDIVVVLILLSFVRVYVRFREKPDKDQGPNLWTLDIWYLTEYPTCMLFMSYLYINCMTTSPTYSLNFLEHWNWTKQNCVLSYQQFPNR